MKFEYKDYWRRSRAKADWAGVQLSDAFGAEYHTRALAQRKFFDAAHRLQKRVAELCGDRDLKPRVKPQLSLAHTSFPAGPAVRACLGHTAFLEFKARTRISLLEPAAEKYLADSAALVLGVDPHAYERLVRDAAESVNTRLLFESLVHHGFVDVEAYRLVVAYQQLPVIQTLRDILFAAVVFGELLPPSSGELHPTSDALLATALSASGPFFSGLDRGCPADPVAWGLEWTRELICALRPYLPNAQPEHAQPQGPGSRPSKQLPGFARHLPEVRGGRFAPLKGKRPPFIEPPHGPAPTPRRSLIQAIAQRLASGATPEPPEQEAQQAAEALAHFQQAAEKASGQGKNWQDMRADLVEQALGATPFGQGPIEGESLTTGQEVTLPFGDGGRFTSQIHDRPLPLSPDRTTVERLRERARPISDALRRSIYPSVTDVVVPQRFAASGRLDTGRLPLFKVSETLYTRLRTRRIPDPAGRALFLLACDGSGSLNRDQMKMAKALACAWLDATAQSSIEVLAALYTSGQIHAGVSGPVVEWIYHPRKTQAFSRADGLRALASLADEGGGTQRDALSLQFLLDEARGLARGANIYVVLLSDAAWNPSGDGRITAAEEVTEVLKRARTELAGKLHITLVALGGDGKTGIDDAVDQILRVSNPELKDPVTVAGRISALVAQSIVERRKLLTGRK
jgi:hypothetical protein